ncbi:MAG: hypothetical protein EOP61_13310 [Sphingomonadales bacterium]|nr:MAG: hypothetical protein EOP61_13310 [Sphingomonadales bacterium]
MRALFLIAAFALAQPVYAQTAPAMDPAKAVAAALAANGGDVQGVFEMTVASSAGSGFNYYLNSEKDYRSDANLAIVIVPAVRNEIVAQHKAEPDAVFQGKRIRVKGVVRRVPVGSHFQTRITPEHASQIEIIG